MVMQTLQIRLTKDMINELKMLVEWGLYASISEAARDAVRRLVTGREGPIKPIKAPEEIKEKVEEVKTRLEEEIKSQLQRARGTKDFLPEEQIIREEIIAVIKESFELYGYSPIDTPTLERFDVLASKYAGGAEILKETFKLKDQGGRELGLRYDLTVPLARIIGMNPQIKMPFKRYQIGNVYRDGPVSLARYRQFIQCDVDVVGVKNMTADAEIIALTLSVFKKLGFDVNIRVSNRKILNGILEYLEIEQEKINDVILSIDKLEKFGEEIVRKELEEKNIDKEKINRLLEIIKIKGDNKEKINKLKKIIKNNEGFRNQRFLNRLEKPSFSKSLKEIEELTDYLNILNINFEFDVSLARGLAYYTGTIFETYLKDSKIKTAIAAGGRYDKIIGQFIGKGDYPAVGISFGLDRIYDAIIERKKIKKKTVTQLFVIPIGTIKESLKIAEDLRKQGIKVDIDLVGRGPSKNLKYANSLAIPFVLFIGEDELKQDKVKLRDMKTGKEELINAKEIIKFIKQQ